MKSSVLLDSVVFQLTPTRTRCELVIFANGKSEKIASGFLDPFLAHLKAAMEQMGKGGYSIVLEPKQGRDSVWFTKGTVERFVRYVSTPEILERVYTIESEILQIEQAISTESDAGMHIEHDLPVKAGERIEGSKPAPGNEKAIVLYQPTTHQLEGDESTTQEKNSKVQLVRVLETRKTVLQKEQGMAFARAVAAGFDIENIAALHSFAQCFGASRMMDACKRFVDLWKAKHESGQWVDVEATETNMPSMGSSGIMLLGSNERGESKGSWPQGEVVSEKNGISCVNGAEGKPQADHHGQPSLNEHNSGQFPHPMYPPWQMHSQANGLPIFQPYAMPGMPYYQNHPGNGPFFQPSYPSFDDSVVNSAQRRRQRRHSMDSRDLSGDSESQEMDASRRTMQGDVDTDEEYSVTQRSRKKGGKSSRKQSGTVVIRNINYITREKQDRSVSDPDSCSNSGTDDVEQNEKADEVRKLKKKTSLKEERMSNDDGHWEAFQSFLLKDADESNSSARHDMFAKEGKDQGRKRQSTIGDASSMLGGRMGENQYRDFSKGHDISGDMTCMRKMADDKMLDYGTEANFESMINRKERLTDVWDSSLDPVITNGFQGSSNNNSRGTPHDVVDDSLVVLHKSRSLDQVSGNARTAINMEYEVLPSLQKDESHVVRTMSQGNYEPDDLNLMLNREEHGRSGYDPALDYEMQAQITETTKLGGKKKEVTIDAKEAPKKGVKDQKLKAEKRLFAGTRREKPYKLSPSEDARARAEKLRSFKADLQKLKKEKEQEQVKRLEALKLERQKRIAAKTAVNPQSPLPTQQAKKQPPKLSPVSNKGSKFSDTDPGSSSPLQRSTLKNISKVSPDSSKVSKPGRVIDRSNESGNRLTRSASSLSVRKEENNGLTSEAKATMARIRRLSEPKITVNHNTSEKSRSTEGASRRRASMGTEMKKMPSTSSLNKIKSGDVQELKSRTSKVSTVSTQKKSSKEMVQKPNDKILSGARPNANLGRGNANVSSIIDGDDSTVVEKTVVMLECERPSTQVTRVSEVEARGEIMQSDPFNPDGKLDNDITVPPPASPIFVKEVDQEPSNGQVKGKSGTLLKETEETHEKEVLPNTKNICTTEEPYRAPYARLSSVEDPCMGKSGYVKAPSGSSESAEAYTQTANVYVPDTQRPQLVKISEVDSVKHQGKESSKGFRRLLKFGKKSSATSEPNVESNNAILDASGDDKDALNGSSSEAFTLKNLLTQEEGSSAGNTPKKSSRSFSLLSPFRSKTSERKSAS